jgi:hypothetical protein
MTKRRETEHGGNVLLGGTVRWREMQVGGDNDVYLGIRDRSMCMLRVFQRRRR